jgi:hypothetical protein
MSDDVVAPALTAPQVDLLHISVIFNALVANLAARPDAWVIILGVPSLVMSAIIVFQSISILMRKVSATTKKFGRRTIRVFEVRTGQISVSCFLFWPAITIPKWSTRLPDIDIQIQHEAQHIERGDSIFYYFIFPISISLIFVSFYLISTGIPRSYADVAFFSIFREVSENAGFPIVSILSLLIVIFCTTNLLVLSLSARDREFMCDSDMYQRIGESYRAFIGRGARREEDERNGIFASLISAFTHPSFASRQKSLMKNKAVLHRPSFLLGCLFQMNFWMYALLFIVSMVALVPYFGSIEFRILASKLGLNRSLIPESVTSQSTFVDLPIEVKHLAFI